MQKKSPDIVVIGFGLSLIYSLGLLIYLWAFVYSFLDPQAIMKANFVAGKFATIAELQKHAVFLWVLYLPQVIGFLALANFKEWGRRLLIAMNISLFLLVAYKMLFGHNPVDFLSTMQILINMVLVVYLSQPRVKEQFQGSSPLLNKRILVVDDDRGLLKMVKACLSPHGYEVYTALTGEEGLRLASSKKPVLIILDVMLPGIKGREVCEKLKEDPDTRRIPVYFLTAKDSPDDVKAEIEAGGLSHITKPIEPPQLLAEIKKIVGI